MSHMKKRVLLFDFDGTIYRGDDPFWFYAQALSRKMNPTVAQEYLSRVTHFLKSEDAYPDFAYDNWQAVVHLAKPDVDDAMIQDAFLETREYMMEEDCTLDIPANLKQKLDEWREGAYLVLASNSPEEACVPLLKKLGLYECFDVVHSSSNKPAGLLPIISNLDLPAADYTYASVGDNFANDIEPVLTAGWVTVHISPRGVFSGKATVEVRNMEDAYSYLDDWTHGKDA